eukprot:TRINITY_DN28976_c0_g1_i1.p3 TRINITY_DN28976_c0_g1~~TRINITY_DN28976_c0_g1_i1.p3  ORF type:complete len:116 (-),score=37.13 TRINITY_DN28976_c0_g1_i1:126-473(-)
MQRGLVGSEMCIRDRINTVMIVAVISVRKMQTAIHDIINVVVVNNASMAASRRMLMMNFIFYLRSDYQLDELLYTKAFLKEKSFAYIPVSYTHLTLPTILLVQISVVAVSLKKKK